jgi:hypothetical protein
MSRKYCDIQLEHLFNSVFQNTENMCEVVICKELHISELHFIETCLLKRLFVIQLYEIPVINDDVLFHSSAAALSGEG